MGSFLLLSCSRIIRKKGVWKHVERRLLLSKCFKVSLISKIGIFLCLKNTELEFFFYFRLFLVDTPVCCRSGSGCSDIFPVGVRLDLF